MSSTPISVQEIPAHDLDQLERRAQQVATRIGPHEGLAMWRFVKGLGPDKTVVLDGDCEGALAYLEHASHTGRGAKVARNGDVERSHVLLVAHDPSYDTARKCLEAHWDSLADGALIAFLDAQDHGVRALLEERLFLSDKVARIGYNGRMVYGRKVSKATIEERRRNRRIMKLWHVHIQLQKVPMPRPVRVAGREVMKRMQSERADDRRED